MKLLLALGAGLLAFFFRASVGPLGDGYWDGAFFLGVLLLGPIGFVSGRWSAALLGFTLLPAAFLADALYRPGMGLESILAAPVALFLTPFAILLLLAGAGVRKLVRSRLVREA